MLFESASGLLQTPHGCAEQTTSAGYANLVALQFARTGGISSAAMEMRALANINMTRDALPAFQDSDGGVRYWHEASAPDIGVTAYALSFLTDAAAVTDIEPANRQRLVDWLANHQNLNGRWSTGDTESEFRQRQSLLLTGLVTRSWLPRQRSGLKVPPAVFAKAFQQITQSTNDLGEPYLLSPIHSCCLGVRQ